MDNKDKYIDGFSKMTKEDKISWLSKVFCEDSAATEELLKSFWHKDDNLQTVIDGFSENTISNFYLPYGVAPNFVIDGKPYAIPMVIEESSVVAAAAAAAKFWMSRGGFKTEIIGTEKIGQVHFKWKGDFSKLKKHQPKIDKYLVEGVSDLTENMTKRGGGISRLEWLDLSEKLTDLRQIRGHFQTCDSMGANFINSILERWGQLLCQYIQSSEDFTEEEKDMEVVMGILSNYTPSCVVKSTVSCPIEELGEVGGLSAEKFAEKFYTAVRIAEIDPYRATTHNKGIFNGIDSLVLATGNDFRAIEACGHTYASKDGEYTSLSHCSIEGGVFTFYLEIALAVGTVGGLTKLHPLADKSLEILGNPSAEELMRIIATLGLAQNFAALRSLTTTGIQQGHMKMHLQNILNHLGADDTKRSQASDYFKDKTVSFQAVREFVEG